MLDVEQIGRYKINRELGRGGMATVSRLPCPRDGRYVCLSNAGEALGRQTSW